MIAGQSATIEFIHTVIPKKSRRLMLIIGFWSLVGFLSSLHWWYIYVYPDPYDTYWQVLRVKLVLWWGWGLLTPALLHLGHRFRITRPTWLVQIPLLLLICVFITILYSIFYAIALLVNLEKPVWGDNLENMAGFVFSMHSTFFFLAAIATILLEQGLLFLRDLRERDLRASQLESQLALAQWQNLQAQLHPHFLFNVLNTSAAQVLSGKQEEAHGTLVKLSELLRTSLVNAESQYATVESEIQFTRKYLELVQSRFPDRLRITVDATKETLNAYVPTLLLQPLVENAIKYGIGDSNETCHVKIHTQKNKSTLILIVINDGLSPEASSSPQTTGLGLKNLRERLRYLYQDTASLTLTITGGGNAEARVLLPFKSDNEKE